MRKEHLDEFNQSDFIVINVVLADGHPIFMQGLRSILTLNKGYVVVGEAGFLFEVKDRLGEQDSDLLILELSMPGGSGLDLLKEIKSHDPELFVLVLSVHAESQMGLRAFKAGASGYLSKACLPEQLLEAIQIILTGRRYFGKTTEDSIFSEINKKDNLNQPRHALLSDREFHVFLKIAEGKHLTEIAKDLSLSVKTVSTYRQRILTKMKKTTKAQIVGYCARHSLLV